MWHISREMTHDKSAIKVAVGSLRLSTGKELMQSSGYACLWMEHKLHLHSLAKITLGGVCHTIHQ